MLLNWLPLKSFKFALKKKRERQAIIVVELCGWLSWEEMPPRVKLKWDSFIQIVCQFNRLYRHFCCRCDEPPRAATIIDNQSYINGQRHLIQLIERKSPGHCYDSLGLICLLQSHNRQGWQRRRCRQTRFISCLWCHLESKFFKQQWESIDYVKKTTHTQAWMEPRTRIASGLFLTLRQTSKQDSQ